MKDAYGFANARFEDRVAAMQMGRVQVVAVVDDDAAVRDSLRFLLEAAGHTVETYSSAGQYLSGAPSGHANCLVVDQHMPQLTGLELLAALRGRGEYTPALLITGSLTPDMLTRAAELGVMRVLEKPLDEDDLLGFVEAPRN
jgi:FixJ family two-component response regulator